MPITHWELTNGSPKRTWRYMTDIYNPTIHWWEYHGSLPIFVTVHNTKHYGWYYLIFKNGAVSVPGLATSFANAKSTAILAAQSWKDS